MKQPWYGGYKANIVTYTISKFRHMVDSKGKLLDLMAIWNSQSVTAELLNNLLDIAAKVNEVIKDTPQHVTNIGEWCKKPDCWENVINTNVPLKGAVENMLIDLIVAEEQKKEAATVQGIDNGIEAQKYVFDKTDKYWKKMQDWNKTSYVLSHKEKRILDIAAAIPTKIPTEKQCLSILDIEKKALVEGFHFA